MKCLLNNAERRIKGERVEAETVGEYHLHLRIVCFEGEIA